MKSAEDWFKERTDALISNGKIPINSPNSKDWIRQIQLDAMKEGMRRAAYYKQVKHEPFELCDIRNAILSAAEQLTEKDLV